MIPYRAVRYHRRPAERRKKSALSAPWLLSKKLWRLIGEVFRIFWRIADFVYYPQNQDGQWPVVQLAERLVLDQEVAGSIPARPAIIFTPVFVGVQQAGPATQPVLLTPDRPTKPATRFLIQPIPRAKRLLFQAGFWWRDYGEPT